MYGSLENSGYTSSILYFDNQGLPMPTSGHKFTFNMKFSGRRKK